MNQFVKITNEIMVKIPLFSPEATRRLIWDGFAQLARIYFIIVIPLDLSFNQEELMFRILYPATVLMIIILIIDLLVRMNTAHY